MRPGLGCRACRATAVALIAAFAVHAGEWPRFRGPTGQGISEEKGVPTSWNAAEHVVWKTPIPGEGWSSPIVWGDRVWVTTATDGGASFRVICIDRTRGTILWNAEVVVQDAGHRHGNNSYATSTPATDGDRVFAVAADGSIAALSAEGDVLWTNREHRFFGHHGLGVSPILYKDLLIVPFDGSSGGDDRTVGWQKPWDQAVVLAVEKETGRVRWKGRRGLSRIAHVTPLIIAAGGGADEIVSGAGDVVQGFDPATGALRWTAASSGEGVVPSIVSGGGLVFSASGFGAPAIRAVRPGGRGDVTATHIAWEDSSDVPMVPSMLCVWPHLLVLTDTGVLRCLEAASGKVVWRTRVRGEYYASPVWADGRIYVVNQKGETTVLDVGPTFKVIASNPLGEKCFASPAVAHGAIFLRTASHLFCIGRR